jgi:hypothetical protein
VGIKNNLILKEKSWAFKQQSQSILKEKTWAFKQQSQSTFKRKNVGISTTISVNF